MGGEGSGRGGGEGRGERFSVWSCSRSARAVSPGSSRRETFPETRAHTAHPPRTAHPRSLAHTHAHTQPGRAGATDHFASAGPAAAQWVQTLHVPIPVFRLGDDDKGRRWARTQTKHRARVGPPSWLSHLLGRARASAESRIKRSDRNRSARRMGTPLFKAL